MNNLLNNELLTKEKLIELLQQAKQDEKGHWYLEIPQDEMDIKLKLSIKRAYFGMFYTVCEDFVSDEYCSNQESDKNTEHYNRHFWNDDTFELFVAKDKK